MKSETVYLFTSFRGNGEDGLHLAHSADGYRWTDLGRTFLTPKVGAGRLMRDPCLLQGPDGVFHIVWTPGWTERGIGYAHSRDLRDWSEQHYIEVMAHEPTTVNAWAPDLFYDDEERRYVLYWSSTIPGRFPGGEDANPRVRDHRIYCTTTKDFKTFGPTKLLFEPGYSVIDAIIAKRGARDYVMIFKDERQTGKRLRVAFSERPLGPYRDISEPFTGFHTEGPTVARIGTEWFLYYDLYTARAYGAATTKDFRTWTDITKRCAFPSGQRHGTVLTVSPKIVDNLACGK